MIIDTYLPLFNGFYQSHFEHLIEDEYCNREEDTTDTTETTSEEYTERMNHVSEECCKKVAEWLEDFDVKIVYQELYSPKFYNFTNDSINCEITFNKDKVFKYLMEEKEAFNGYIKDRYTSRPGFISFHSNDGDIWIKKFMLEQDKMQHYVGSIFDFILDNEDYNDYKLSQEICL